MSFLDNLENNLKALEGREERDPEKIKRDQARIEAEKNAAKLTAPYAELLRTSPFTQALLTECRTVGHGLRVLVQFTWLADKLRLDAKTKRMELIPTPEGIVAVYSVDGAEVGQEKVNPAKTDPKALATRWLQSTR
jgi:hypothetical protein